MGLVPVEAMASGVPVVGSLLAQSAEAVIEHGVNGWTVNAENQQQLKDTVWDAIQTPAAKLSEMSALARQAVNHISAETSGLAFLSVINQALAKQRTTK